jgi:hypothetical protein
VNRQPRRTGQKPGGLTTVVLLSLGGTTTVLPGGATTVVRSVDPQADRTKAPNTRMTDQARIGRLLQMPHVNRRWSGLVPDVSFAAVLQLILIVRACSAPRRSKAGATYAGRIRSAFFGLAQPGPSFGVPSQVAFARTRRMTGAFAVLRSLSLIAAIAFVAGFLGYLALDRPSAAVARADVKPAIASGPASDDWNLPKHI